MKKIITIIIAACALITSVSTGIWYLFDNDPKTNPDMEQISKDYSQLRDAIMNSSKVEEVKK